MARDFVYRARNKQGKILKGKITADTIGAAKAALRQQNVFVVEIKPAGRGKLPFVGEQSRLPVRKVSARDLALFCRQLATMIKCGIPIVQCLKVLSQQTENKTLVRTIDGMVDRLERGNSLGDSARAFPGVFPRIFNSMLDAGELSGSLDKVMERLASHFEKESELQEKIKSAMTYPMMVAVVAVLAVAVLMVFVIPSFMDMLVQYDMELPLITRIAIDVSDFIRFHWYILLSWLMGMVFAFRGFSATRPGREIMDRLLLRLPVFGGLNRRWIISRFARTLGILLHSGVPLLQALEVVKGTAGNVLVENAVAGAVGQIKEGRSIAGPLQESGVFPPMFTRLVAIGEETGAIDTMLEKLAQFYDREVEHMASRLASLIEPALIVGLGGVVGFIILSIMMPMFSIASSVN